jgi:ornithine carbamoyltransferase
MLGCALVGMNVRVATPPTYQPNQDIVEKAQQIAGGKTEVMLTDDPTIAAKGAHVIYTDVWASMGQEDSADERIPIFQPYQVNEQLFTHTEPEAIVLHCLPAHRGEEITEEVMESSRSRIWDQAENRMHVQKALLVSLLGAD